MVYMLVYMAVVNSDKNHQILEEIRGKTTEKTQKKQLLLVVTALKIKVLKVVPPGIEPGTQGFSVLCSTN